MKKTALLLLFMFFVNTHCAMALGDDFSRSINKGKSKLSQTYNYENLNKKPLKISPMTDFSSKKNLVEGQKVVFLTTEDVIISHNKVLPSGSRVTGIIETITEPCRVGIPANLVIGSFKIEHMPKIEISGQIIKKGANRIYWVLPLVPALFLVKGGYAKIDSQDVYKLYYMPKEDNNV